MNQIYLASEVDSDLGMIMPLFDQLQYYTKYHFDEEEQFLPHSRRVILSNIKMSISFY